MGVCSLDTAAPNSAYEFQCTACSISVSESGNLSLYKLIIHTAHPIHPTFKFPFLWGRQGSVSVRMCSHARMHLSMHKQRVDKRASSTKSVVCSQLQIAPIIPVLRHGQSLREEFPAGRWTHNIYICRRDVLTTSPALGVYNTWITFSPCLLHSTVWQEHTLF